MSSDSAENNPPKEKSFELDLSSLGFGPSWVSGPSEKVSSGNGGPRRDGDRPRFRGVWRAVAKEARRPEKIRGVTATSSGHSAGIEKGPRKHPGPF